MPDNSYPGPGRAEDYGSDSAMMDFVTRSIMGKMATGTPVEVTAVSANGRKVSVKPLVKQIDPAGKSYSHGIINGIPVLRLQSAGYAIIIKPQVGDKGYVAFAHSDISSVIANEGEANPGSRRKFDWSDGIYMGGLFGDDEPEQYIEISGSGIKLASPNVETTGNFKVGTGATGSFTDASGQVITVVDGIITEIV